MKKSFFLLAFLLYQVLENEATVSFDGGFDIDLGLSPPKHMHNDIHHPTTSTPSPASSPTQTPTPVSDQNSAYTALQAWKSAITDDPLKILDTWVGPDVCSYKGIFCDQGNETTSSSSGPNVASIDLNQGNLQGKLVKELSCLKNISVLHLNSNRFSGEIPQTLEQLLCLEELDLSNNNFSGPFPNVALCIPNLAYLDLRFNKFSGPIPDALFNNKKIDAVLLNDNNFDGQVPESLGNSAASVMNFANNKLTGSFPTSFNTLGCHVQEIVFLNNQLTGCMPPGIGLFPGLEVLDFSQNSLTGHIPDTLAKLTNIEVLNLGNNKFSGQMPDFCGIKSLQNLTVSNNFFSGFGPDCSKLLNNNLGFNFSFNCIPKSIFERPPAQCSIIPGGSLNCLRIPIPQPFNCGKLDLTLGLL